MKYLAINRLQAPGVFMWYLAHSASTTTILAQGKLDSQKRIERERLWKPTILQVVPHSIREWMFHPLSPLGDGLLARRASLSVARI